MNRIFCILFLIAGSARASVMGSMTAVEINQYQLIGAEYWPFLGDEPFRYPGDVLWGFYPDGVTPEATECAEKSYRALTDFLRANWAQMQKVVALGGTRRFYLWTNDYTEASPNRTLRTARMWHWNSGSRDLRSGFWKWEAILTQDGRCVLPPPAQIRSELDSAITELSD
jgi:hypothetical protein